MKVRFPFLIPVLLICSASWRPAPAAETPPGENRMVHRQDDRIVDGAGQPLKLRGVNLGDWLLWEPWIWGGHLAASESKLSGRLEKIVGQAEMARFRREIYDNFVTEGDIQRIAGLGFNVVRVPLNSSIFEEGAAGWQILDRLLSWAEKYRVYVVLDLHAAPGGQSSVFTSDPQGQSLWSSADNQSRTVALWRSIAERYRDRRIVAGYDLLNEPGPPDGDRLVAIYRRIVAAIREVDPSHMILVEGGKFASDFSMFKELLSPNQTYSFHMYTLKQDNRTQRLDEYRQLSKAQHAPLWCGEFGVNSYEMIDSTLSLFDNPEYAVSGWAFWTWKRSPGDNPSLMGIKLSPRWTHLIDRASSPLGLGEPSRAETLEAMKEFVAAVRVENNVDDAKMGSILTSHAKH